MEDESPSYELEEISQYIDDQIENSRSYYEDVRRDQEKANQYYYCRQDGDLAIPEVDGRSGFVSSDVSDLVEWMLPSLMEMFTANADAVTLEPEGDEDVESAEDWQNYLNYLFYRKNNGFIILYQMVKDALLEKIGTVRVDWVTNKNRVTNTYYGLMPEQVALMQEEGEITAATQREDGLIDIQLVTERETGTVKVTNVPNTGFYVSADAQLGERPSFIAHVSQRTLSSLRTDGWNVPDDVAGDLDNEDEPLHYGSPKWDWDNNNPDESMKLVRFIDAYCYYDLNDDGIAEYCRVVKAGDKVLTVVEVEDHPFATALSIIAPHEFYGISPADQAIDFQKLNTDVMRAFIDNMQMQVNGRIGAVDGQVNIDDLLTIRPGGIVRMKNQGAVFPIQQPNVLDDAMQAVQVFDTQKENRTGWTKYSQGTDSSSLNKTATGINIITNRGDMRLKLIARTMAETGITEIFRKMMKVAMQNATGADRYRLNGKTVQFDPRNAGNYDFVVNVGLGAGNKDQKIAHLTNMITLQEKAMQMGVATQKNVYNAMSQLAIETGFKSADQFFTNPEGEQDPEKAQMAEQLQMAEQAVEQLKGMLQDTQMQSEERIQALEQQLDNIGENEKTKQAAIQAEIEREKTRQKEIELAMAQVKQPIVMDMM